MSEKAMLLILAAMLSAGVAAAEPTLSQQMKACMSYVWNWNNAIDIGAVMHKVSIKDVEESMAAKAANKDWPGVLLQKRNAEISGFVSPLIDENVKLALTNMPMFIDFALPVTQSSETGRYFWPWNRYVLYGYRYAEELNWETQRWDADSAFRALASVRDWHGRAFYACNPDGPMARSLFGTRWHQAGSLMDCFFILYNAGVKEALGYAVAEWEWLNNWVWLGDHFGYSATWQNWEFCTMSVFPNVAKLHLYGKSLDNWERVATDIQLRYLSSLWKSPLWHSRHQVVEHHHPDNPEERLDGTLSAWIICHMFYGLFNEGNQTNMRRMLEGDEEVVQAWKGLLDSDLKDQYSYAFRMTDYSPYSEYANAKATLCLFLMGISPQSGRGLAVPLVSDKFNCHGAINLRHFEYDSNSHTVKIPVWGGSTLKFLYGDIPTSRYFKETGIYRIKFHADWNSISTVEKVSELYEGEYYLLPEPKPKPRKTITVNITSPRNQSSNILPVIFLNFTTNATNPANYSYSLDGGHNVTVSGNTTISGLTSGTHDLTVYVRDSDGSSGSATVQFSIRHGASREERRYLHLRTREI